MSFVKCVGSKCSDFNDISSPLLFHEIIHGDSIDPFATALGRKKGTSSLLALMQVFAELLITTK